MVWQEVFDNGVDINKEAIIHVWKSVGHPEGFLPELSRVTKAGYNAVLSSCWYLNYIKIEDWPKYYNCDPRDFQGMQIVENLRSFELKFH